MTGTIYAERVEAREMPTLVPDLAQQGLTVFARPRGPQGSGHGRIYVQTCYLNPDPYTATDRYGQPTERYKAKQTIVMVDTRGTIRYYPLRYRFGKGWRPVTFRVFVA